MLFAHVGEDIASDSTARNILEQFVAHLEKIEANGVRLAAPSISDAAAVAQSMAADLTSPSSFNSVLEFESADDCAKQLTLIEHR